MIDWLNQNQGAAIVIVTSLYVLATIVIVLVSSRTVRQLKKANALTRAALDQTWAMERERSRPFVIFDFVIRGRFLYALLKNYGQRPALRVTVDINPPLLCDSGLAPASDVSFVADKVPLLAPGREIRDLVTTDPDFMEGHDFNTFHVKLSYLDSEDRRYEERIEVPMGHYMHHWLLHCRDSSRKDE